LKYYDFIDKASPITPLVIVEGTERQFADLAISTIEERIKREDPGVVCERYRAPAMDSFRPVAEALVSLGFFSSRRVIVVRDVHELRAAPRRALWEIAQTVTEPSVLVLEELVSPTKKTKPEPLSTLAPRGTLKIDTTASAAVRGRYIEDIAKAAGVKIEAPAMRILTDGGADLGAIRNDLERLALEGVPIKADMLARESVGVEDPKAYKYAGALVAGNDAEAFRIAAELFEDDPRGAAIPLLSALATEYGLLWELARGNGELPSRHRWRERILKPLAQKIGPRVARRGFERAVKGFEAIVTGRADDPRLLVEAISAECAYERAAATRRR
jgi:DNA polymerase III delta subunit